MIEPKKFDNKLETPVSEHGIAYYDLDDEPTPEIPGLHYPNADADLGPRATRETTGGSPNRGWGTSDKPKKW